MALTGLITYTELYMRFLSFTLIALILASTAAPVRAADLEVSGWIPYWSGTRGTTDAKKHLSQLDVIHPFSHTILTTGKIKDLAGLDKSNWTRLVKDANKKDVLVVPTVMSGDGDLIHTILSDSKLRRTHVKAIIDMVEKGKYDGVDIDYEGKRASTSRYFSDFLEELKEELGSKMLSCTIEARTPPDSLYRTVPDDIQYANDYDAINEHCDRVNIMAYDQQRADLKLNDSRKGEPYIPVADAAWVEKVLRFTMKSIDKDKLVLGIATYGAEWELQVAPEWFRQYSKLWALNPVYAVDTYKEQKIEPYRNKAGELSFTYFPKGVSVPRSYKAPKGTHEANEAAARALAYANATGNSTLVNVVWWSDAKAVEDKVKIAEKLGIQGVSLFKIDGGEDKNIWKLFP